MNELSFNPSTPLTLGIELEWQILDPESASLKPQSIPLLKSIAKLGGVIADQFKPELVRSMIEVNSTVHQTPFSLLEELYSFQDQIQEILAEYNLCLAGGGTHPFERWTKREVFPKSRFINLHKRYGFLFKRFSVFGQHIHIGCASKEDALYLIHALAAYVPHFIALSASSPLYSGVDTFFDCSRLTVVSAFPTSGVMPFITDWKEFENYFQELLQFNVVDSLKDLYWDIRPNLEFGTVELRICDSPLSIKKAVALGAYAQALCAYLLENRIELDAKLYFPYRYNRFSAMRYGLNASIMDITSKEHKPLSEDILDTIKKIKPYAAKFNAESFLNELEKSCSYKTNDAQTLRNIYQTDGIKATVHKSMELWNKR